MLQSQIDNSYSHTTKQETQDSKYHTVGNNRQYSMVCTDDIDERVSFIVKNFTLPQVNIDLKEKLLPFRNT
jgi:hypothetical protein